MVRTPPICRPIVKAGWLSGLLVACLALAGTALAETVTLRRGDGNSFAARLAGDWSRCGPTLILSHGLGGDERALGWMDSAAAASGFRLLVMEHRESGPRQLLGFGRRDDPEAEVLLSSSVWDGRAADLATAIGFARQDGCRPRPFVLGGHSMGAALTMFEAGARGRAPYRGQDRFDAYIAVSPQGLGWAYGSRNAWSGVSAPVLMITGTSDETFGEPWTTRLTAFRGLPPGKKRLAVIPRATHLNLGGIGNRKARSLAADVAEEFLRQIAGTWGPSQLDGAGGMEVRDK
jgi:pimeloyl-ACP methyl ester carboxylesterase